MADSPEAIKKSVRMYLMVGLILFAGTVATVLVATVPWLDVGRHGFDMWDCLLGLAIAATKASCVAAVFMHLNHERKAVYWIIGSGVVFAAFMVALIALAKSDPTHDPLFYGGADQARLEEEG